MNVALADLLDFQRQPGERLRDGLARLRPKIQRFLRNGGRLLIIDPGKSSHFFLELTAKDADKMDQLLPDPVDVDGGGGGDTEMDDLNADVDDTIAVGNAGTAATAAAAATGHRGQRLSERFTYGSLSRHDVLEFKRGTEYGAARAELEDNFGVTEGFDKLYQERRYPDTRQARYQRLGAHTRLEKLIADRATYGVADLEKNTSLVFNTLMSEQFKDQAQRAQAAHHAEQP